jgi:hypothetical protein
MSLEQKLADFKARLQMLGRPGIALDIDDTLSQTAERCLDQLTERFGNPTNLTLPEIRAQYGMFQHVPQWNNPEAHDFIEKLNNSPENLKNFALLDGVHEALRQLQEKVPITCYLTARSEIVASHTQEWLDRHGFPAAELICRPHEVPVLQGGRWKAEVLYDLSPHVVGLVDDNVQFPSHLPVDYPGAIYLIGTETHSYPQKNVFACPTWADVIKIILNR